MALRGQNSGSCFSSPTFPFPPNRFPEERGSRLGQRVGSLEVGHRDGQAGALVLSPLRGCLLPGQVPAWWPKESCSPCLSVLPRGRLSAFCLLTSSQCHLHCPGCQSWLLLVPGSDGPQPQRGSRVTLRPLRPSLQLQEAKRAGASHHGCPQCYPEPGPRIQAESPACLLAKTQASLCTASEPA